MNVYDQYKVDVPEGCIVSDNGSARIERFSVNEREAKFSALRNAIQPRGNLSVPSGSYTRLLIDGILIMSDTPSEIRDHLEPIRRACGTCLVNGLGLGMVANAMLAKPEVDKVITVEINEDVIALVAPHWKERWGERLEIVHADALEYQPPAGVRFNVVWHDIWAAMCTDNLQEMFRLHRKYGRRCEWQGSWKRSWLLAQREHEKRQPWY